MMMYLVCIFLTIGAGAVIITRGIRAFIVGLCAVASVIPLVLLLKIMFLNYFANPQAPFEQILPSNFWIYVIPMGIFVFVTEVVRVRDGYGAETEEQEDSQDTENKNKEK